MKWKTILLSVGLLPLASAAAMKTYAPESVKVLGIALSSDLVRRHVFGNIMVGHLVLAALVIALVVSLRYNKGGARYAKVFALAAIFLASILLLPMMAAVQR